MNFFLQKLMQVPLFLLLGRPKGRDASIKRKKRKDEDDWEPEIHDIKVEDEDISDDVHDKGILKLCFSKILLMRKN